jgi:hypothetical protein
VKLSPQPAGAVTGLFGIIRTYDSQDPRSCQESAVLCKQTREVMAGCMALSNASEWILSIMTDTLYLYLIVASGWVCV